MKEKTRHVQARYRWAHNLTWAHRDARCEEQTKGKGRRSDRMPGLSLFRAFTKKIVREGYQKWNGLHSCRKFHVQWFPLGTKEYIMIYSIKKRLYSRYTCFVCINPLEMLIEIFICLNLETWIFMEKRVDEY